MIWIALLLLACFGALVGGIVLWLNSQGDRASIAPHFEPVPSDTQQLGVTVFIPPTEREAVAIVKSIVEARDVETIHALIHENQEVDADEMLAFLSKTPERDGKVENYQWIGTADVDDLQIQRINVIFEKDHQRSSRIAMLIPDDAGVWRLDFTSFARWCDPPIESIDSEDGYPGGRIRVMVGEDYYFNGPFADDREWACYAFASPDAEARGLAYCRIGSPEHIEMSELLASGEKTSTPATLEVRRVEGAHPRQFELTKVVSGQWLAFGQQDGDSQD